MASLVILWWRLVVRVVVGLVVLAWSGAAWELARPAGAVEGFAAGFTTATLGDTAVK